MLLGIRSILLTALCYVVISYPVCSCAAAEASLIEQGRVLAEANCASCHSLELKGDSPLPAAMPFRVIARMYKSSDLEKGFAERLVVGHPPMPEFEATAEEAASLVAFIQSLGP